MINFTLEKENVSYFAFLSDNEMTDAGGNNEVNASITKSSGTTVGAGTLERAGEGKMEVKTALMKRIFESLPTPMHLIFVDRSYRIQYISEKLVKYRGYKRVDDVIGMEISEFFETGELIKTVIDTGKPIEKKEMVLRRYRDGEREEVPVLASCNPVYDDSRVIIGAVAAFTEMAELKRAIEVAERNMRFLDGVPAPVMAVDREFNVICMNEAAAKVVGVPKSECIGRKCYTLFNTTHCNTPECGVSRAVQSNRTLTLETIARLPGGEIPVRYTAAPLKDAEGRIIGGIEYVVDITEETRMIEEIKRLIENAKEGLLDARCDVSEFDGGYKKIAEGMNAVLDAIVAPLRETIRIMDAYRNGRLSERAQIDVKGEFKELADALNNCGEMLQCIINDITHVTSCMSLGDLSARISAETPGDFAAIKENINSALDNLCDLIVEMRNAMDNVASVSRDARSAIEQTNSGMQQIASASQQVAKGSQEIAMTVGESAKEIKDANEKINEMRRNAEDSSNFADKCTENAIKMRDLAIKSSESMDEIGTSVENTIGRINSLRKTIEEIGKATEMIESIADQTNLLALNAAIEAARAGEHGRGFAVVAEEVRKLAENSKRSTAEIDAMIKTLKEEMNSVVESSKNMRERANAGKEDLKIAVKSVEDTENMIEEIRERLRVIAEDATRGAEIMERISKGVDEIASAAEESASSAEETSSAIEQQTAAIQELNAGIQKLADLTNKTVEMINRYKVRADATVK